MNCATCTDLAGHGRRDGAPIHCTDCHSTWTGNEAQHCVVCHLTFTSISAADAHRYRRVGDVKPRFVDRCEVPWVTPGWREKRPGVWTNTPEASA